MNTINNTGLNTDLYWQKETVKIADGTEQQLTQEDFFSMLTEQLANQDPTAPVDNDQMVAQMTSFTMADGISQLNEKFESFAASMTSNQALQASSLIGQNVLVQGNVGYMANEGDGISGVIVNEKTVQNMTISIENQFGEVIKTIDAGTQSAGNIEFEWDGKDKHGNQMAPGEYVISANNNKTPAQKTVIPKISAILLIVKLANELAVFFISIFMNQFYHFVSSNFSC